MSGKLRIAIVTLAAACGGLYLISANADLPAPVKSFAASVPSNRWYLELGRFADAKAAGARWKELRASIPSLPQGQCCTMFSQGSLSFAYIGPFESFYEANLMCNLLRDALECRLLKGEAPPIGSVSQKPSRG